MFNPDAVTASTFMTSVEAAARSLKVEPIIASVHGDAEIETAIVALGREPRGGLVVNNVPAVYWASDFARNGGLLSMESTR
jgi:hypothetical protein